MSKFKIGDKVRLNPNMDHTPYLSGIDHIIKERAILTIIKIGSDKRIYLSEGINDHVFYSYNKYLKRGVE